MMTTQATREETIAVSSTAPVRTPTALLELDEEQQGILVTFGERLIGDGRFEEAARVFVVLLAAAPGNGYYNRVHGVCCERLERYDEALVSLERAIAADPSDVYARACRASIRLRSRDRAAALEDLRAAEPMLTPADSGLKQRISMMIKALAA